MTKIKLFIDKYNWERINYPSKKDDWKKKKYPAYVSKHNSNREKQIILLMITNGKGCHSLVVKKLSALLRGIKPKIMMNVIVWNVFIVLEQKQTWTKLKSMWK